MDRLAKKLARGYFTLEELGVKLADVRRLKDKGYRVRSYSNGGKTYYSTLVASENVSLFLSGKKREATTYAWVDMADVHVGSKHFDETGLRDVLHRAVEEGFKEVHIAGDLCDGYRVHRTHLAELRFWTAEEQADLATEIFSDYPLAYYAIRGNHCASFEALGSPNPLQLIQERMKDFTYLPTACADLIVGGVAARMVHLGGGNAYAMSYPGQVYLRNLFNSVGKNVWANGKKYRLRFLSCGHLHSSVEYESAGVFVTHPGNFQFPSDFTVRKGLVGPQGARFVRTVIEGDRVIEFSSRFTRPRRGR